MGTNVASIRGEDAGGSQGCTLFSQDAEHCFPVWVPAFLATASPPPWHSLVPVLPVPDFLFCVYLKLWLKVRLRGERGVIWGVTNSGTALKGLPDFHSERTSRN